MSDENPAAHVPTEDLLGLGVKASPTTVRLRDKSDKVDRRSHGVVFGENFQVTAEQDAADKELTRQAYNGRSYLNMVCLGI